jgi:hypothetical protein
MRKTPSDADRTKGRQPFTNQREIVMCDPGEDVKKSNSRFWWILPGLVGLLILLSGGNFSMFSRSDARKLLCSMAVWLPILIIVALLCWTIL